MGVLMLDVGGRRVDGANNGKLWIARDGLDEWWNSAEVPEEGEDDEPRTFDVKLLADASSPEWAELDVRTWAAGLSRMPDLGFRVFHADRWLSLRESVIRAGSVVKVRPHRNDMRLTDIVFTVRADDPRKYGRSIEQTVDAAAVPKGGLRFPLVKRSLSFGERGSIGFPGVFRVHNPGTADFTPVFKITGAVDGFTLRSEGFAITYAAPIPAGKTLTLSPYAGGRASLDGADVSINLTEASWVPVHGGQTRGYRFTPGAPRLGSRLVVQHPEGAWW